MIDPNLKCALELLDRASAEIDYLAKCYENLSEDWTTDEDGGAREDVAQANNLLKRIELFLYETNAREII